MFRRFSENDEQAMEQLSGYWDSLVSIGTITIARPELGRELAATVRQVHEWDVPAPVDEQFASDLLEQLIGVTVGAEVGAGSPRESASTFSNVVRGSWPVLPAQPEVDSSRHRRHRMSTQLGVAAAIVAVLVIIAGLVIWTSSDDSTPIVIPAPTETPKAVQIEPILDHLLPPGSLIENRKNSTAIAKYSLDPGEAWRDTPMGCPLAPKLIIGFIESGVLSLETTGPFEIYRADGSVDAVRAGVNAEVNPGDYWVYLNDSSETFTGKRNLGDVPVVSIEADWWLGNSCETVPSNPGWQWSGSFLSVPNIDFEKPIRITFERAMVAPLTTLTAAEGELAGLLPTDQDIRRSTAVDEGTMAVQRVPDALNQAAQIDAEAEDISMYTQGDVWNEILSTWEIEGKEWQFSNPESEPLEIVTVVYRYDEEEIAPDSVEVNSLGVGRTTLLEYAFDANAIDRSSDSTFVINRTVVPQGAWLTQPQRCGTPSKIAATIESGRLSFVSQGNVQLLRDDGEPETVPPGTSGELSAGDAFVYSKTEDSMQPGFRSTGVNALVLISAIWFPETACNYGPLGSDERTGVMWVTTDRLPALSAPIGFTLRIDSVGVSGFETLSEYDILGFSISVPRSDNLARMAIEAGTVVEVIFQDDAAGRHEIASNRFDAPAIVSLDDPLVLGEPFDRTLMRVGVPEVELTVFSLTYDPPDSS